MLDFKNKTGGGTGGAGGGQSWGCWGVLGSSGAAVTPRCPSGVPPRRTPQFTPGRGGCRSRFCTESPPGTEGQQQQGGTAGLGQGQELLPWIPRAGHGQSTKGHGGRDWGGRRALRRGRAAGEGGCDLCKETVQRPGGTCRAAVPALSQPRVAAAGGDPHAGAGLVPTPGRGQRSTQEAAAFGTSRRECAPATASLEVETVPARTGTPAGQGPPATARGASCPLGAEWPRLHPLWAHGASARSIPAFPVFPAFPFLCTAGSGSRVGRGMVPVLRCQLCHPRSCGSRSPGLAPGAGGAGQVPGALADMQGGQDEEQDEGAALPPRAVWGGVWGTGPPPPREVGRGCGTRGSRHGSDGAGGGTGPPPASTRGIPPGATPPRDTAGGRASPPLPQSRLGLEPGAASAPARARQQCLESRLC